MWGEKSQRSKIKWYNRRNCTSKQIWCMEYDPISPQAGHKINPLMKIAAYMASNGVNNFQSGTRSIIIDIYIGAHYIKISIPGILKIKGLNKSKPWDSSKYVVHIWLNKNIHLLLVIQERGNLLIRSRNEL